MPRKPFSEDERRLLQSNPHVAYVNEFKVYFTPEFKKTMYEGLMTGKTVRQTLKENGIPPEVLGDRRIWGIDEKLRAAGDREGGFDGRGSAGDEKPKATDEPSLEKQVRQLKHELAYALQQIEFLKKIRLTELEARKQCDAKTRRK